MAERPERETVHRHLGDILGLLERSGLEAEVKERVAAFETGWRRWSEVERTAKLLDLSEIDHDLVSAAIARRGLKDLFDLGR